MNLRQTSQLLPPWQGTRDHLTRNRQPRLDDRVAGIVSGYSFKEHARLEQMRAGHLVVYCLLDAGQFE
jgi:hypothetical protein